MAIRSYRKGKGVDLVQLNPEDWNSNKTRHESPKTFSRATLFHQRFLQPCFYPQQRPAGGTAAKCENCDAEKCQYGLSWKRTQLTVPLEVEIPLCLKYINKTKLNMYTVWHNCMFFFFLLLCYHWLLVSASKGHHQANIFQKTKKCRSYSIKIQFYEIPLTFICKR